MRRSAAGREVERSTRVGGSSGAIPEEIAGEADVLPAERRCVGEPCIRRAVVRSRADRTGLSQISGVDGSSGMAVNFASPVREDPMILSAIADKLKRRSKDDFKGRHFQASLILEAVLVVSGV